MDACQLITLYPLILYTSTIQRAERRGERGGIVDGEVFRLGIPGKLSLTSIRAVLPWTLDQAAQRASPSSR